MIKPLMSRLRSSLLLTLVLIVLIAVSNDGNAWPKVGTKPAAVPERAVIGKALFLTNCSGCHGADAKGGDGPNLHRQGLTATFISATIRKGVPGDMPAFKKLSPTQLSAVVRYVGSLQ